jgi:hypothetical protein
MRGLPARLPVLGAGVLPARQHQHGRRGDAHRA